MSFERVALFAIFEFNYIAPAGATAVVQTDLPGNALVTRATLALPASAVRRTVKLRVDGVVKGKQYRVIVGSGGIVILFGGRVWARQLGGGSGWEWYALPIAPTANEFREFALPIPKSGETFTNIPLPIEGTAEKFSAVKIPMIPTPELFEWVDVPVAK